MPERITLDAARRELGISMPVRVELHASLDQAKASYLGVVNGTHRIALAVGRKTKVPKVGTTVAIPSLAATVWHELTHALQCERDYHGNSEQARHHYNGELARRLGINKTMLDREFLHTLVRRELRARGFSAALNTYEHLPWEQEAMEQAKRHAHIEVTFPVSPKTRRDARR